VQIACVKVPVASQTSTLRIVLVGLVSLAIAVGIGRFAFTPLLPLMQEGGLVTIAGGGALASVHFVGYWLGALFAAKIPWSPKTSLRFSLVAIGLCTAGMGITDSFPVWLGLRWLAGVCSAFVLVLVSNFYLRRLDTIGRADKQGWVFSGVGAGIVIAGLGAIVIMVCHISSSMSWGIFGIATLVAVVAVCAAIGPELPGTRNAQAARDSCRAPQDWNVVIAYGAAGIGYIIPATYLPVMAREVAQMPLVFGWGWPIFGAAAFVSTVLAAKLQAGSSNRQVWAASQIVMAVGLLLPALYPHIVTIFIAGLCVGGTFMIVTMAGMKEAHRLAPTHDVMRHIGVMTAAFATGQMVGPLFAGILYDLTGSFSAALVSTSAALIVTAIALRYGAARKEPVPT